MVKAGVLELDASKARFRRAPQHLQPKPSNSYIKLQERLANAVPSQPASRLKLWGWSGKGVPSEEEKNVYWGDHIAIGYRHEGVFDPYHLSKKMGKGSSSS